MLKGLFIMWLEQKYIGLLSSRLSRFKRVNRKTYNFRCPICGDSRKNQYKARGFLFAKDSNGFLYHCHNCNVTLSFDILLKELDPSLHNEFLREKIQSNLEPVKERKQTQVEEFAEKMKKPNFIKFSSLLNLKKISQLKFDHPAKLYIQSRKIPNEYHAKLFYAPRFKEFVNSVVPEKFSSIKYDEPRLIIPFIDESKNLIGFQGRSFDKDADLRYITIMIDETKPKIFGLDTCDRNKLHYIFEGPIDSMFVRNSMAMAGGSIDWNYVNENSVFVYDNEPRSRETIAKITKTIDRNHKVVIFPEMIYEKDINDMVLKYQNIDINSLLEKNVSEGLESKILLTAWRRI